MPDPKKGNQRRIGSRISSYYSGDGRAVYTGKGLTVIRNLQRKLVPDTQIWITQANLPAGNSEVGQRKLFDCGSEYH
jgi:hypothetical protein